jgi:hypothetical protein
MSVLGDMNTLVLKMNHGIDFEKLYTQLAVALTS